MKSTLEDKIKNIKYDRTKIEPKFTEALELYHTLVEKGVIKPRENQLNNSGCILPTQYLNR